MIKQRQAIKKDEKRLAVTPRKAEPLNHERILTGKSAGPIVAQLFFFFSSVIWEPYALLCLSILLINEPVH